MGDFTPITPKGIREFDAVARRIPGWPGMKMRRFLARDLVLVAPAPPPDNPALGVGDKCRINSGGPDLLVVDCGLNHVLVAWRQDDGQPVECALPRACVRRSPT